MNGNKKYKKHAKGKGLVIVFFCFYLPDRILEDRYLNILPGLSYKIIDELFQITCFHQLCIFYFSLNSFGVKPNLFLNTVEKYEAELKPTLKAISETLNSFSFNKCLAFCKLIFSI